MKVVKGLKIGGLQQKIFNLVLVFILLVMGVYAVMAGWLRNNLSSLVQESNAKQQASIVEVSEQTMESILSISMSQSTALQGYIADDLFNDVRTDVVTLQTFATELFEHSEIFSSHPVDAPSADNDGRAAVMLVHEKNADPENSEALGLVGNMSEIMLAMYEASDKLSSIFVGTADGNMVLVNDRSATYVSADGTPLTLEIRQRPWYAQASEAGELIFTGVELDAFTDIPMLECAAPVYHDGQLVAVVSADIFLDSIRDYVDQATASGGFLCVVDGNGHVLFSSRKEGILKAAFGPDAQDLRQNENEALAGFVTRALREKTSLELIGIDGKDCYITAVPMTSVGWTVLSGVEKEVTGQPAAVMLASYDDINAQAVGTFRTGLQRSVNVLIIDAIVLILLASVVALTMASRIVKPLERMTKRINSLHDGDTLFEMEKSYRTGDEIEILAESFATLSKRSQNYIAQITRITAEKERIGTELALATRIQADMLPNIFPAFPDRPEFDIYASMDPAKEVGGDFYDFFLIDDDHLGLVMADVSGKGVPAALFMMIAKILVQNYAMNGAGPAEVLEGVNNQICTNNREEMFVTIWFGILDLKTGRITAANAGHEYPALMLVGGQFELMKDKHGFVIGGMEGVKYSEYTIDLAPGSRLFLYTDGVPEAANAENELFGTNRMLAALNADRTASPQDIIRQVRHAVDEYVEDAEQFDDLTMLCVEFIGRDAEKTDTVGPEDPQPV